MRHDLKCCPSCGAPQQYHEFVNKRTKCEKCSDALGYDVHYQFQHGVWSRVERGFFKRLETDAKARAEDERARRAEARAEEKAGATKVVFDHRTGRAKEVPLFRTRDDLMWDDFTLRLEQDVETRQAKQRTWREISAFNNAANELGADGKVKKVRGAVIEGCTFQPQLATKPKRSGGPDDEAKDVPIDIDAFVERQMDDAAKRKRYYDEVEEEEKARMNWFDEYAGLRDTAYSSTGDGARTANTRRGTVVPDDW